MPLAYGVTGTDTSWRPHSVPGLLASDFSSWTVSGHPDFSSTGTAMSFGYVTANGSTFGTNTKRGNYDNWQFVLQTNSVPTSGHTPYGTGCYSPALSLGASPNPVSTATTGTTVTYAIDDIPDTTGTSGVHFGATVVSFGANVPGLELGFLGAPGCSAHVASLDVLLAFSGPGTSNAILLDIPPGVPPGTELFVQAVAVTQSGLLNPAGLTTSNGVQSIIYPN